MSADPRTWPRRTEVEAELAADAVLVEPPPTPARMYFRRGPGQPCPPWPVGTEVRLVILGEVVEHQARADEVRVLVHVLLVAPAGTDLADRLLAEARGGSTGGRP